MSEAPPASTVLLGRDHVEYGRVEIEATSARTVCAICVGGDPESPSLGAKGDDEFPNEDALVVVEQGAVSVLAVMDAHFGIQASHDLAELLTEQFRTVPRTGRDLAALLQAIGELPAKGGNASATTLAVAVLDRASGSGFGISYGDSSIAACGPERGCEIVSRKTDRFVTLAEPRTFELSNAEAFRVELEPGDLVLAFSDGLDECHYGRPATSVRPDHLTDLYHRCSGDPARFVEYAMALALAGVDGNPGGQDNLVLAATRI